ncbi:MAG TPA: hypothetical protein VKV57_14875 [bacterium]|nr:hypothetical protein [bacterium]
MLKALGLAPVGVPMIVEHIIEIGVEEIQLRTHVALDIRNKRFLMGRFALDALR